MSLGGHSRSKESWWHLRKAPTRAFLVSDLMLPVLYRSNIRWTSVFIMIILTYFSISSTKSFTKQLDGQWTWYIMPSPSITVASSLIQRDDSWTFNFFMRSDLLFGYLASSDSSKSDIGTAASSKSKRFSKSIWFVPRRRSTHENIRSVLYELSLVFFFFFLSFYEDISTTLADNVFLRPSGSSLSNCVICSFRISVALCTFDLSDSSPV